MQANSLINETSPYLLQHAYNPVNWFSWSEENLKQALEKNKLLVISIGYSTCHWCHVMEHESFENNQVAEVMNQHFISIKVDREERPDVDQVYMNALQMMTGSGGWPLNIIALPDGRPVWGGTYVNKDLWIDVLNQLHKLHQTQPQILVEYATKLEQGIKSVDVISKATSQVDFKQFDFDNVLNNWSRQFDLTHGGTKHAPKFMMPNNLHFLMRLAFQNNNKELEEYVNHTLTKMAFGGIFDHINGGFSRYAVDEYWHVPHFEKMLYDNAQLASLYSDAFAICKNPLYKEVVYEILNFVKTELMHADGGFFSALDADSLNEFGILEEGAYYVFTKNELEIELEEDFNLFSAYYNINDFGHWQKDYYVLIRTQSDRDFCDKNSISAVELNKKKVQWKKILLNHRATKNKPRLDHKIITSWNAMMVQGYCDAYKVFRESEFLETAVKNAQFLIQTLWPNQKDLKRVCTNGQVAIDGFLEDYAHLTASFISLYENTFDEKWVQLAKKLIEYCIELFYDKENEMFFYTSHKSSSLISKPIEVRDNVIPASNSVMAKNLFWLGTFYVNNDYLEIARKMLVNVLQDIEHYPPGFSNWLDLMLNYTHPFYEVVIVGNKAKTIQEKLYKHYIPNVLFAGSEEENKLPLIVNRFVIHKTKVYVCENGKCQLPVEQVEAALNLIELKK